MTAIQWKLFAVRAKFLWENPPTPPQGLLGNGDGYWLGHDDGKEIEGQLLESAQVWLPHLALPGPSLFCFPAESNPSAALKPATILISSDIES